MRKIMILLAAFAIALGLAVVASAHDRHGFGHRNRGHVIRGYPVRSVRVIRVQRPVRVLGARYYRPYNYGRRRSAFIHHRNSERRALRRYWMMEHRRARRHHRAFIHR